VVKKLREGRLVREGKGRSESDCSLSGKKKTPRSVSGGVQGIGERDPTPTGRKRKGVFKKGERGTSGSN